MILNLLFKFSKLKISLSFSIDYFKAIIDNQSSREDPNAKNIYNSFSKLIEFPEYFSLH